MNVIDLFAGCGGLSLGFTQAGFSVDKAVEFDSTIANTYMINHPSTKMFVKDVGVLVKDDVFHEGDANIVIGGSPCQGFSMVGARTRKGFVDDPRNYLFRQYFNVVRKVKPMAFVMENVKGLMTMRHGEFFKELLKTFSNPVDDIVYDLHYKVIKATDFGVPQKRERLFIIGSRKKVSNFDELIDLTKEEIRKQYPNYFDKVTVRDAIGNLPEVTDSGEVKNPKPQTAYQQYLATTSPVLTNHIKTKYSAITVDRMSRVANGANFTSLKEKINSVYSGSFGRLCWDEPATTITTRFDTPACGRYIHPSENRTLSPREAARIQSFPDSFVFHGSKTSIRKQIGNAVPPKVSYFLARLIKNILKAR